MSLTHCCYCWCFCGHGSLYSPSNCFNSRRDFIFSFLSLQFYLYCCAFVCIFIVHLIRRCRFFFSSCLSFVWRCNLLLLILNFRSNWNLFRVCVFVCVFTSPTMSNQCRNCGRDVNNNYTPYTNAYGNKTNAKNDSSSSKISNTISSSSSTSLSQHSSSVAAGTSATATTIATGNPAQEEEV